MQDSLAIPHWEKLLIMVKSEERWRQLCAKAAVEQDPQKLMDLVKEISRLLDKSNLATKSNMKILNRKTATRLQVPDIFFSASIPAEKSSRFQLQIKP